jgi:hypothetical protein
MKIRDILLISKTSPNSLTVGNIVPLLCVSVPNIHIDLCVSVAPSSSLATFFKVAWFNVGRIFFYILLVLINLKLNRN